MIRLFMTLLLLSNSSHAVTRVGGGIASDSSNTMFLVDDGMYRVQKTKQNGFLLISRLITGPELKNDEILVDDFAPLYPEALGLDQAGIRNLFEYTYDFTAIYHSDACVVGFYKRSATQHVFAVTWGNGEGFVFRGNDTESSRRNILTMIRTLTLAPGACGWN